MLIIAIPGFSQNRAGKFGIGVDGSMQYMLGAGTTNASPILGYGINFSYSALEYIGIRGKFCYSPISWKNSSGTSFSPDMISLNLFAGSNLMPNSTFNIFPFIGAGMAAFDPRDDNGARPYKDGKPVPNIDLHIITGLSIDYFLNEFWSVSLMDEYVFTNSQYYAGSADGNTNSDRFMRVSLQVRYYFFDSSFITKLIDSQRDRSKRK
jgi:outer membrane protein W